MPSPRHSLDRSITDSTSGNAHTELHCGWDETTPWKDSQPFANKSAAAGSVTKTHTKGHSRVGTDRMLDCSVLSPLQENPLADTRHESDCGVTSDEELEET